jgi:hypothetical protein
MTLKEVTYRIATDSSFAAQLKRAPRQTLASIGASLDKHELSALLKTLSTTQLDQDDVPLGPLPPWRPAGLDPSAADV